MLLRAVAILSVLSLSLLYTGCTHYTLSEDQCRAGNWEQIGFQDGSTGFHHQRINKHAEACSEYKMSVNKTRYLSGWNEGVKAYCTPQIGYQEGINGESYEGVCPAHLEVAFLERYHQGYSVYQIRSTYRTMTSNLEDISDDISELETKFIAAKPGYEQESILSDLKSKRREKDRLTRKIRVYELKHAQLLAE